MAEKREKRLKYITYKGKVLDSHHPENIRIQLLALNIILAIDKDLKIYEGSNNDDDLRRHLEGLQWKFLVVDDPRVRAYCVPGGKIVIHTGLLEKMSSDDMIAFVIAHEVAHAVARHVLETLSKLGWWETVSKILKLFLTVYLVNAIQVLFKLPLLMRTETEADSIALLLMAIAGYDPRAGPEFVKKFDGWMLRYVRIISMSRAKLMHDAMKLK